MVRSCLLITLIKCLKGDKSLGSLCSVVKTVKIVSGVRQTDRGTKGQSHLLSCSGQLKRNKPPTKPHCNSPDHPTLLLLRTPHLRWGVETHKRTPMSRHPGSILTFTNLRDDTPDSCARVKGLRDMIVNGLKEKVKVLQT